jgi:hypothetical protein
MITISLSRGAEKIMELRWSKDSMPNRYALKMTLKMTWKIRRFTVRPQSEGIRKNTCSARRFAKMLVARADSQIHSLRYSQFLELRNY